MTSKRIRLALASAAVVAVGGTAVALGAAGVGRSGDYSYMYRMMGPGYAYQQTQSAPVNTLAGARADAQKFADRLGLKVAEVLHFEDNFYAKLVDDKGSGATEVLVDPGTGSVSIEYGPAMMWNTRYGMGHGGSWMMGRYGRSMMQSYGGPMTGGYGPGTGTRGSAVIPNPGYGYGMMGGNGGMMRGYGYQGAGTIMGGPQTAPDPGAVSMARAHTLAQQWLDANESGVKVETGGDAFPGYYTLETLRDGKITGMISVNASTGAVWPHWWHGAFIASWEA